MKASAGVVHERTDPETRRHVRLDQSLVALRLDRGLKSGKWDVVEMSPADARTLAAQLLIAAERADGRGGAL